MRIVFPPFFRDSRGNRLSRSLVRGVRDSDHVRLYLCGPEEVARQIEWVLQSVGTRRLALTDEQRSEWTHRLHVNGPIPRPALRTISLLERVLTLTDPQPVDVAIALDFYKDPDSHEDPKRWKDTAAGSMVNAGKYWGNTDAFDDLAGALAQVISEHPIYAGADFVVAVPGHKGDSRSFGEQLAAEVARQTNKPLLRPATARESRQASKEREQGEAVTTLDGEFEFGVETAGRVLIVVDDVHRSGNTMAALAKAAKDAGAVSVLGLAGAQTMRR